MAFWRPFETETENSEPAAAAAAPDLLETCWEFKNKDLHVQCQRVVLNMYECLKKENNEKSDRDIAIRICELTKISFSTVSRIIQEGDIIDHSIKRKRKNQKFKNIDGASKDVIRRTVYDFYKKNIVPTLEMIQHKLRDYPDFSYKSLETLRGILLDCGFKHKKIDNRMIIMESRRIIELRGEYLSKIKEYREANRNIVYLDETWFDTHDVVRYGWVDDSLNCSLNTPCSRGKRVIILHAGSKNGFVPNALLLSAKKIADSSADYHEDMTADLFEKWFTEQLIPNIPPNSVIIMDNASYHSRILHKIPNMNTRKDEILNFMKSKNMNIPEKCPTKKQLITSIKECNFKNEYVIDNICKTHGHTPLRLPPYYCIFNPIEQIWADLKSRLRKRNQSPTLSATVIENIREIINELNETDLWEHCVSHVVNKENEYFVLPPVAPLVIQTGNDSSSDCGSFDEL